MRDGLYIIFFLGLMSCWQLSFASPYQLDEAAVDLLFAQAEQVSADQALIAFEAEVAEMFQGKTQGLPQFAAQDDDKLVGAIVLCWFVGGLGIHRVFLGGRGALIAFYFCTGGGCGVVWLVDFIILCVDGTRRFENNDRFIAW